jgi:hypothetical protein
MNDVIQYQRLASGYVPGLSEVGTPAPAVPPASTPNFGSPAPSSALLQNCIVVRPVAVGIYDVLVGGGTPAPVGIGGVPQSAPPLVTPPAGTPIVQTGRVSVNVRSILPVLVVPPTTAAASPQVEVAIFYGASLGPAPQLYTGFSNDQLVRIIITSGGALADADFDFSIERVIDPTQD